MHAVPLWKLLASIWPSENHAAAVALRSRLMPFVGKLVQEHTAAVKDQEDTIKAFKPEGLYVRVPACCMICT